MTPRDIFETDVPQILAENPELLQELGVVVHFNVAGEGGGLWTLDCTKADHWIVAGAHGEPHMTLFISGDDFVKIRKKELNASLAAMQGKITFKPMDIGLAMKLAKLLG
ncbi:MAG: SCP2 sterol-binding domain-containing protein [Cystobacterineae bacterium]|nr:SCP2 sterol-binding domain-containing protein [Cystobacterineae bacterium]